MVEGWNSGWGKLIADARDGRSQAWLADETGIDASLISRYEREEVSLKPIQFRKLTNALRGLSPADFRALLGLAFLGGLALLVVGYYVVQLVAWVV